MARISTKIFAAVVLTAGIGAAGGQASATTGIALQPVDTATTTGTGSVGPGLTDLAGSVSMGWPAGFYGGSTTCSTAGPVGPCSPGSALLFLLLSQSGINLAP